MRHVFRYTVGGLIGATAFLLWHTANMSSPHAAWLLLLAWTVGSVCGVLAVLDWLIKENYDN